MNYQKVYICLGVMVLAIICVALFWKYALFLILLLGGLAYLKNLMLPIKKAWIWFIIIGLIGAFGESLIMLGGAWSYSETQILNFPLWLPFLWGLAGAV